MPWWGWTLAVPTGILALLLFLFRVRYRLDWNGTGFSAVLEYGFPGLMRVRHYPRAPSPAPPVSRPAHPPPVPKGPSAPAPSVPSSAREAPAPPVTGIPKPLPRPRRDRERARRALFLLLTDGKAWNAMLRYLARAARWTLRLQRLEVEAVAAHPDPAKLGTWAGCWHAVSPLVGLERIRIRFRFQEPAFILRWSARGGFSGAGALSWAFLILGSFPWIPLSRRLWRGWRHGEITGWRAPTYSRLRGILRGGLNS